MVEILFLCSFYIGVTNADGFPEKGSKLFLCLFCIAVCKRLAEQIQCGRVFPAEILEPFVDLPLENLSYFKIRDCQFIGVISQTASLREVSRHKKRAPDVLNRCV